MPITLQIETPAGVIDYDISNPRRVAKRHKQLWQPTSGWYRPHGNACLEEQAVRRSAKHEGLAAAVQHINGQIKATLAAVRADDPDLLPMLYRASISTRNQLAVLLAGTKPGTEARKRIVQALDVVPALGVLLPRVLLLDVRKELIAGGSLKDICDRYSIPWAFAKRLDAHASGLFVMHRSLLLSHPYALLHRDDVINAMPEGLKDQRLYLRALLRVQAIVIDDAAIPAGLIDWAAKTHAEAAKLGTSPTNVITWAVDTFSSDHVGRKWSPKIRFAGATKAMIAWQKHLAKLDYGLAKPFPASAIPDGKHNTFAIRRIVIPHELVAAGAILSNCAASYVKNCRAGRFVIFGVYKRADLVGMVSVATLGDEPPELYEAKGPRNEPLTAAGQTAVDTWWKGVSDV